MLYRTKKSSCEGLNNCEERSRRPAIHLVQHERGAAKTPLSCSCEVLYRIQKIPMGYLFES